MTRLAYTDFSSDSCRFWRLRRGLVALKHPANVRHRARVLAQARAERIATNGSPDGHLHGARATAPWRLACPSMLRQNCLLHNAHCTHRDPIASQNQAKTRARTSTINTADTAAQKTARALAPQRCNALHSLTRSLARLLHYPLHGTRTAPTRPRSLREGHSPLEQHSNPRPHATR